MSRFIQFIKAAGEWGRTSVIGTAILVVVSLWGHVRDHNLAAYLFALLAAALFCWGAFKAWDAERRKLEEITERAKKPDVRGPIIRGYIDAQRFSKDLQGERLQDLREGSFVSFIVSAVNHSECPAHFERPPHCQLEIFGKQYQGVFESCPLYGELSMDDPSLREKRLHEFFANIWPKRPMLRGEPHSGWMRFYVKGFGSAMMFGRKELPTVVRIEFEDTLGGHHSLTSDESPILLQIGKIRLTSDLIKQQSA